MQPSPSTIGPFSIKKKLNTGQQECVYMISVHGRVVNVEHKFCFRCLPSGDELSQFLCDWIEGLACANTQLIFSTAWGYKPTITNLPTSMEVYKEVDIVVDDNLYIQIEKVVVF